MARHVKKYIITAPGRDKGKTFIIEEMCARPGAEWADRMLFAMANSGADIPDSLLGSGMAGLAVVGLQAIMKVPYDLAKPLLDEMMTCVTLSTADGARALMLDDDIEEIATFFSLRKEIFMLHVRPFTSGVESTTVMTPAAKAHAA